jgi:hypothetical protein
MIQLYSARNALEAHRLRSFLAGHGIDAAVTGDNNAVEVGFSPTPQSAPCVYVSEADFERARFLLEEFSSDSISESEEHFDGDSTNVELEKLETLPGPTRSATALCLELLVVLAATMPIFGGHSLFTWILQSVGLHSGASSYFLRPIIRNLLQVGLVLVAICLSGEHWSTFGLKKRASADWVTAYIVCFVAAGLSQMGVGMFIDFLK